MRDQGIEWDGGPAFPVITIPPGMTLRDWFAGQALAGIIASERDHRASDWDPRWWTELAYRTADAMLAERAKPLSSAKHNPSASHG